MKLINARLKGLIGVCRASGLHDITIDFTKCKHDLVLIIGKNGSGKSTIMDALHPMPDPASNFLPKEEGMKELTYIMQDGTMYQIQIIYPVNKNGDRQTTKAYLKKIINGEVIELNSNGNISSYKEILHLEFKLDAAFVSLSHMSVENRGIVDKTPAERKKYVGNVTDKTEAYNIICKTMNKRSSAFKSMKNSISAKIDTIGNEEHLNSSLTAADQRLEYLENEKTRLEKLLAEAESMVKLSDPDGQIQSKYLQLLDQKASIMKQIETLDLFLTKNIASAETVTISDYESCLELEKTYEKLINDNMHIIILQQQKIESLISSREEEARSIQNKVEKLNALKSEYNYKTLEIEIKRLKNNIIKYESMFKEMGISPSSALTKDEFVSGLNVLKDIKEQVDILRSYHYDNEVETAVRYISENVSIIDLIQEVESDLRRITEDMISMESRLQYLAGLTKRISILNDRPETCTINTCSFIKDALEAKSDYDELEEITLTESLESNRGLKIRYEEKLKQLRVIANISSNIQIIIRNIQSNQNILKKLPNGYIYSNLDEFLTRLIQGSTFSEIHELYSHIDKVNIFELYKHDKETLSQLESEYKIFESKNSIIDEIQNDIQDMNRKMNGIVEKIEYENEKLLDAQKDDIVIKDIHLYITNMKKKFEDKNKLFEMKSSIDEQLSAISCNMIRIEESIKQINHIQSQLSNINHELIPLRHEREKLRFSAERLREYKEEMAIYENKYELCELIKKYSSPTKDGIQNLFIEIYMGQTLDLSNKLLATLFDGSLQLGKYVINEKEFRIPCISMESPIPNDDISSCSTSQKCMISMILGFALLKQGSTKYNILRLDEIDHGLDQDNKAIFISLVQRIMRELEVEMCIMVSHATESVMDNADIILLSPVGNSKPAGNIIFSYADQTNTPYAN